MVPPKPIVIVASSANQAAGIPSRYGSLHGSFTALARDLGVAYSVMAAERTAASTSPGAAPRGHISVQSPQLWHSQMSPLLISLSLRPHEAAIISFLGKGLPSGAMGQATEHV